MTPTAPPPPAAMGSSTKLGSKTTATQALRGADLTGKVALVTGGNSGIGAESVRAFAMGGAWVVLACRRPDAGQAVADEVNRSQGCKGKVTVCTLDLADLASVQKAGEALAASLPRLDILCLNAGVMALRPRQLTADGYEMQFGVCHLGHFVLAQSLLPTMKAGGQPGRVVVVSSSAHGFGRIQLDDLSFEKRWYGAWKAYGQAKLANLLFVKELARRLKAEGSAVEAFALHPGIVKTSIGDHFGCRASLYYFLFAPIIKSPTQGAASSVFAATAPELAGQSGAYLEDCRMATPWRVARDADKARQLWVKSEELVAAALQRRAKASVGAA